MGEDSLARKMLTSTEFWALMVPVVSAVGAFAIHQFYRIFNPKKDDLSRFPLYDELHGITYSSAGEFGRENIRHIPEIKDEPEIYAVPENSLRDAVETGQPKTVNGVVIEYHQDEEGYTGFVSETGYIVPFRAPDKEGNRLALELMLEDSLRTRHPIRMQVQLHESGNFLVWR